MGMEVIEREVYIFWKKNKKIKDGVYKNINILLFFMLLVKEWKKGGVCGFRFVLIGIELYIFVKFIDEGVKMKVWYCVLKGLL